MTEVSVATDLGALLRDSIDAGLNQAQAESGHMPVELSLPMSGVQSIAPSGVATRIPTPGEFSVVPLPPPSTRAVTIDAPPPAPVVAVAKRGRGRIVGMLLGAVALAAVMGAGAVGYVHHQQAKMAAAVAPPPPMEPTEEEARVESVATAPEVTRTEEHATETAEVARVDEAPAAPAPAAEKVEAKPTKRAHRTAKAEAPKPATPKPAPAPKAEKVVEAPKPAPVVAAKPAPAGAVDAVLQQQLSGAIP